MAEQAIINYKFNNDARKVKFLREASDVQRVHTLRKIGEYTVGQHTFNMLAMLRITHPEASVNLIWAIIEHDIPERLTGDMPAPAKWWGLMDRIAEDAIEETIIGMIYPDSIALDSTELKILKSLDILELYLWCRDQIAMGNSTMEMMKIRIEKWIKKISHQLDSNVLDLYYACKNSDWALMPDLGDVDVGQ